MTCAETDDVLTCRALRQLAAMGMKVSIKGPRTGVTGWSVTVDVEETSERKARHLVTCTGPELVDVMTRARDVAHERVCVTCGAVRAMEVLP